VLSFPADTDLPHAPDEPALLGDIVICAPLVAAEAEAQGKAAKAHWAHLVVHGVLHLTGYDHEAETDAEIMESRERRILAELGFDDPYEER
jgi:probable rRNA maturation factor